MCPTLHRVRTRCFVGNGWCGSWHWWLTWCCRPGANRAEKQGRRVTYPASHLGFRAFLPSRDREGAAAVVVVVLCTCVGLNRSWCRKSASTDNLATPLPKCFITPTSSLPSLPSLCCLRAWISPSCQTHQAPPGPGELPIKFQIIRGQSTNHKTGPSWCALTGGLPGAIPGKPSAVSSRSTRYGPFFPPATFHR